MKLAMDFTSRVFQLFLRLLHEYFTYFIKKQKYNNLSIIFRYFNEQLACFNELLKNWIGKINKIIPKLKNETFCLYRSF